MGLDRPEYVVITIDEFDPGRDIAISSIQRIKNKYPEFEKTIQGPCRTVVNNDYTFIIGPDGSKEGWDKSDAGDIVRQEFMDVVKLCSYAKMVHFRMGGDGDFSIMDTENA